MPDARIFLVEDNPNLGFAIMDGLQHAGYKVNLYTDGLEGLRHFAPEKFDICLLDIMLPRLDGFTLAQEIRKTDKQIPLLFLTAKSLEEDKLHGFNLGADDYITKPFSMSELICRIRVFLKRTSSGKPATRSISLGTYTFSPDQLSLNRKEEFRTLTQREADVLTCLYTSRNQVVKREEILHSLWGEDDYFMGRSLDVFISRLRKYLKDDPSIEIRNYHGIGFCLHLADEE